MAKFAYKKDPKLDQKCVVVLENIASTSLQNTNVVVAAETMMGNSTVLRRSARIAKNPPPCMKVGSVRIWKKRKNSYKSMMKRNFKAGEFNNFVKNATLDDAFLNSMDPTASEAPALTAPMLTTPVLTAPILTTPVFTSPAMTTQVFTTAVLTTVLSTLALTPTVLSSTTSHTLASTSSTSSNVNSNIVIISEEVSTQSTTTSPPNSISTQTTSFNQRELPMETETPPQSNEQLPIPSATRAQTVEISFAEMQENVLRLLGGLCSKFLKGEDCGPDCRYNHSLPSTVHVAAAMNNWSSELIRCFYVTCVQRNSMGHKLYFLIVCDMFGERHQFNTILGTVKDCEELSSENGFYIIFVALTKRGMSADQSLFLLCNHTNKSLRSIQAILEVMRLSNLNNFPHTAALISSKMQNYEINPVLSVKMLERADKDRPLNAVISEFCTAIKSNQQRFLNFL